MLNWAHIDSVLLDLDGTLLDLHYDNYFWNEFVPARYAQNRSLSVTDAKTKLSPRMLELQGTLDWYCVDFWSKELNLDILALKTELRHLIKLRPGARSFLSYLQTQTQRVIMNWAIPRRNRLSGKNFICWKHLIPNAHCLSTTI